MFLGSSLLAKAGVLAMGGLGYFKAGHWQRDGSPDLAALTGLIWRATKGYSNFVSPKKKILLASSDCSDQTTARPRPA